MSGSDNKCSNTQLPVIQDTNKQPPVKNIIQPPVKNNIQTPVKNIIQPPVKNNIPEYKQYDNFIKDINNLKWFFLVFITLIFSIVIKMCKYVFIYQAVKIALDNGYFSIFLCMCIVDAVVDNNFIKDAKNLKYFLVMFIHLIVITFKKVYVYIFIYEIVNNINKPGYSGLFIYIAMVDAVVNYYIK
jgi:hypothetical protein